LSLSASLIPFTYRKLGTVYTIDVNKGTTLKVKEKANKKCKEWWM